ncbi:MAG: hypothetical protein SFW09_12990, partial [Hyphomicrobiaceae bacterium]|nr:hypothetical protein [Hyphomicrobiaceae bacterium]
RLPRERGRQGATRRQMVVRAVAAGASILLDPGKSSASARPPVAVADWLRRAGDKPFRVPLDYVGLHSDHGLGKTMPAPDYGYDAIRSHDTDDGADFPALQWARIERKPGVYDWSAVDAWMAAHPAKTRIWVLFGCPSFYQKYPGEPWRYPYLPGGGSPPRDPAVAGAFVRALLARHPGKIRFVEIWNEPSFGWGLGGASGRWSPLMEKPGFFTGTAADLAGLARMVRAALPAGVGLLAGAWESHWRDSTAANGLIRFSLAGDGAGRLGRDHVDALSVHVYTVNGDVNAMIDELRGYRQRFADAGYKSDLPAYVTEVGAEAPEHWTEDRPSLAVKVTTLKRWLMIPAALGFAGAYLYKHSDMRTLGDPARVPELGQAITAMREALRGRLIVEAARLDDGTIWLSFADGTTVRA